MSDQFYSYLSNEILEFFKNNPPTSGAKYNIQFESEDQVKELYYKLKGNYLAKTYEYRDSEEIVKYKSYLLDFEGIKLIVAATIDDVQPDFLTRLRNMVGVESGYEDKAILFIHNTTLDSIMGGTESFSKEGMPFHVDSVQKYIRKKLSTSRFTEVDKAIIEMDLERKVKDLFQDNNSIFEYKEVLAIIDKKGIEIEDYRSFGLFHDSELNNLKGKELKKRIEYNLDYYSKVDDIHNYGTPESQLERYFDEKGVSKLKKEEWRDVDFKEIKKSIENKKEANPLEYIGSSQEWDKEEGISKSKSRIRNIIVFNEEMKESIDLEFKFDDYLNKKCIYKEEGEVETSTSGKKLKVTIKNVEGKSKFYKVIYKTEKNVKFEFKILMVTCNEKYLENIKTKFSIIMKGKDQYILIKTNESSVTFNEFLEGGSSYAIDNNYETIEVLKDERLNIRISDDFQYENDSELVKFNIKIENETIHMGMVGNNEKIAPIEGIKVWKLKREKKSDFKLVGLNKLQHGTKEYFTRDEFRRNLELEKQIIDLEGAYFKDTLDGLESSELNLDKDVMESYKEIIRYYKLSKKVPSLTYLSEDLVVLYKSFIRNYLKILNSIEEGTYLNREQKDLFKIGVIKREIEDKEIIFTPLHPLNIAYQLKIYAQIEDETIKEDVLKKLTSTYLLPYIICEDDSVYVPMEQYHSPEWKYYVDEKLPRYKSSRDFVAKLVEEKIEEFVGHFEYMFNMGSNAPIKINLLNTGDSKEILQGIFRYYVKQLKSNKAEKILPMDICIYSERSIINAFEEVAFNNDIDSLKEIYSLNLSVTNMSEEDVLDLYREKVKFYSKSIDEDIEYAHVTFLEMNNDAKTITSNMEDIPTGVILDGTISGVPSVFLGDSYRTGFGTKYANTKSDLMNIAVKLNALNAAVAGEPFSTNQCKAISIPSKSKVTLDNIYDNSHWVTFINPKVDLNFFKNDPEAKDLLIIHYSDQYTTAGGYDAITVTRKSTPYQKVIEEFLTKKDVENVEEHSPEIINMFNAINGDWLLRLLSSKSHFPREKISILSAVKLALAEFKKDNIIWVPISLEEILRVSGGAGLKQSEGFFSAKNLGFDKTGYTSDDILLVGIEEINGEVKVYYYPIEVKIGENSNSYIQKGIEQAKNTKEIFDVTLTGSDGEITSTQRVYRNFLMQLVVTSAEKLNLYDVCNEENWKRVIDSDLRRKLLNEEYEISSSIENVMGKAAVISFKRGVTYNDIKLEDEVMVIEMSEDEGINFITKTVGEIRAIVDGVTFDSTEFESYSQVTEKLIALDNDDIEVDELVQEDLSEDKGLSDKVVDEKIHVEPSIEAVISRNMEIVFGVNQKNNKEILWCPNDTNKLLHTNTGIIGTMGTGKTQFTKSMITQIYKESKYNLDGEKVGILIFDYKGDYNKSKTDFIEATDAKVFELFDLPFNPLAVIKSENSKPMLPLHIANSLKETLSKAFGLGIKQETLLRDLIMESYEKRGIIKNKPDTWDNPAPTLKDVFNNYITRDDLKEDSLYAAFSNLIDFQIFEEDPYKTKGLFELIDGVTVIDLSGYDPGIQNLVVAITLDLFYSQMQAYGHSKIQGSLRQLNKIILVDEADNFLSKDFSALKKILKEGREFGVGTILSTQLLSHFSTGDNEYSNYILSWVIHRVDDLSNKDVRRIFNTQSKQEEEILFNKIKSLNKHFSMVRLGDSDRPIYMQDKAFWQLIQ